ncbi:hypothetical protein BC936DRAFT_142125 [Jimgerdemannia flammicorona]|uniref:Uncharacterized protein n=2 Tax=Jimgerdemannia flammicorona TaxID=994334 RepID=A0A433A125_9FUNG|nr:hypothetical protein BC936DRAFT_142125 [Jimgerdemannia flammicorona]RUS29972.1 hypothetical protein BC938DRAFT_479997 [Jimgerdemannia flammicorona]
MQHSAPTYPSSPFPRSAAGHEGSILNPSNVLAHLCWLHQLNGAKAKQKDYDFIYLAIAEQRYSLWLEKLHTRGYWREGHKVPVPPIDVLLMWHTHMVSPWKYYEDIARLYGTQSPLLMEDFPLHMATSSDNLSKITWNGNDEVLWNTVVTAGRLPYTLTDKDLKEIAMECPWCTNTCTFWSFKYMAFLKGDIIDALECTDCHAKFTADTLSAKRFIKDLERALNDEPFYLGGTLLEYQTGKVDLKSAKRILRLLFPQSTNETQWLVRLGSASGTCHWAAILDVFRSIESDLQQNWVADALENIRKSYQDVICPYSLDLIAAVQRHRQFTEKIVNPAWCNTKLNDAIDRYHAFLRLLSENPNKLLVPTLDIELVRHTHMLFPSNYREYTYDLFHRVLIHDDTIPDNTRKASFKATESLWQKSGRGAYAPLKSDTSSVGAMANVPGFDTPSLRGVSLDSVAKEAVEEKKKKSGALERFKLLLQMT